jgi:hypothetical protein
MVSDTDILGLIDNLRYLLVVWKQHPIFTSWSDVWNYVDECFVLHPHTRASSDESKATASGFICRRNHDLREIRLLKLWCNCISLQCTRGSLEHASIIRAQQCKLQHPIQVSKLKIVWETRSNQNQNRRSSRSYQHRPDSDTKLCETTGSPLLTHYRAWSFFRSGKRPWEGERSTRFRTSSCVEYVKSKGLFEMWHSG